jgi:hypothetical protein
LCAISHLTAMSDNKLMAANQVEDKYNLISVSFKKQDASKFSASNFGIHLPSTASNPGNLHLVIAGLFATSFLLFGLALLTIRISRSQTVAQDTA